MRRGEEAAEGKLEWVYGRNPVYEVLRAGRRQVHRLLVAEGAKERGILTEILTGAEETGIPVEQVNRRDLDHLGKGHQGLAANVSPYPYSTLNEILVEPSEGTDPPLVMILDTIQDPQNLGTLLRTAEAVGVHGVVIPFKRSARVTPAVVAASAGACEYLRLAIGNLAQSIRAMKRRGLTVIGLEKVPEAVSLEECDLGGALAIVVGSEGRGLRRLVRESCDLLVSLPMRGRVTSLNAAVAGSIVLYAAWQQRRYRGAVASGGF